MTKRSVSVIAEYKSFAEICAMGLRKGKWTEEEEKYASAIISHFENNLLPLSEQRESTIRLYLGKRLHCDPMRISKKFAGNNSIGKHFFCKKQEIGQSQTAEALGKAKEDRDRMRRAFIESVEKEYEAASKRPKRIRIRNRKKKPKGEENSLQWKEFSDDDIGELQLLLEDKVKEEDISAGTNLCIATPPRESPQHHYAYPQTPPTGPLQSCFHDSFVLDCGQQTACAPNEISGTFVEPASMFVPQSTMPAVMNVRVPYGYTLVCGPPQQTQTWICPQPLNTCEQDPSHFETSSSKDDIDVCLEEILSDDETNEFTFLNSF